MVGFLIGVGLDPQLVAGDQRCWFQLRCYDGRKYFSSAAFGVPLMFYQARKDGGYVV